MLIIIMRSQLIMMTELVKNENSQITKQGTNLIESKRPVWTVQRESIAHYRIYLDKQAVASDIMIRTNKTQTETQKFRIWKLQSSLDRPLGNQNQHMTKKIYENSSISGIQKEENHQSNQSNWKAQQIKYRLDLNKINRVIRLVSQKDLDIKQKIDSIFWESFVTLKMADQYEQVGQKVKEDGYKFAYPTLFCCGRKDLIQDIDDLKKYFNSISSEDKQMLIFEQGYHQLQNDYESEQLMRRVFKWMEERKKTIKWKQPKPFVKDSATRKQRFWIKLGMFVGLLLLIVKFGKKIRRFFSRR